ncbi:c-type cytochrome [Thalassospira xiamenensis]|uniref:c-type cytochrome n=1 Tax=Thalassospira xiamenensis TaxID=220697 RepID=UPI000DEDBC96|nr:cytochrome c [Thalassospira xiamenensis]RCK38629.1 cytochrome C [Thalassospira xiamenensis]
MKTRIRKSSLVILITGAAAATFLIVSNQLAHRGEEQGDIARGKAIAEQTCLRCHMEFAGDPYPDPEITTAPPLASFGQRWPIENLEEALAEGITVSHDQLTMPEFTFTPETIADLLAYMDDLSQRADARPAN